MRSQWAWYEREAHFFRHALIAMADSQNTESVAELGVLTEDRGGYGIRRPGFAQRNHLLRLACLVFVLALLSLYVCSNNRFTISVSPGKKPRSAYSTAYVSVQENDAPLPTHGLPFGGETLLAYSLYCDVRDFLLESGLVTEWEDKTKAELLVECHYRRGYGIPEGGMDFAVTFEHIDWIQIKFRDTATGAVLGEGEFTRGFAKYAPRNLVRRVAAPLLKETGILIAGAPLASSQGIGLGGAGPSQVTTTSMTSPDMVRN